MHHKDFTANFQRLSFELGMTGSRDNSGWMGLRMSLVQLSTKVRWGWSGLCSLGAGTLQSRAGTATMAAHILCLPGFFSVCTIWTSLAWSTWCPLWLWLSLFDHLPPHGTRSCCQHLQGHLLPEWASPSLTLSSCGSCSSHNHPAFDSLQNGSFPRGECILFCKEIGKVNYTDTLHSTPVSRESQSCVQAPLCYRQVYS